MYVAVNEAVHLSHSFFLFYFANVYGNGDRHFYGLGIIKKMSSIIVQEKYYDISQSVKENQLYYLLHLPHCFNVAFQVSVCWIVPLYSLYLNHTLTREQHSIYLYIHTRFLVLITISLYFYFNEPKLNGVPIFNEEHFIFQNNTMRKPVGCIYSVTSKSRTTNTVFFYTDTLHGHNFNMTT